MVKYEFGIDFNSKGGALTLDSNILGSNPIVGEESTHLNDSGWEVTAILREDWDLWVNEFKAKHKELGVVEGDFEEVVYATSKEAFDHFWEHHKPDAWDYMDI